MISSEVDIRKLRSAGRMTTSGSGSSLGDFSKLSGATARQETCGVSLRMCMKSCNPMVPEPMLGEIESRDRCPENEVTIGSSLTVWHIAECKEFERRCLLKEVVCVP